MPILGEASLKVLETVHPQLQELAKALIVNVDFAVREGYRSDSDQQKAFDEGRSRALPGKSKHNTKPSKAVHFMPYPFPQSGPIGDRLEYTYFAGVVIGMAMAMGIKVRWGGDWNKDWRVGDNGFNDLAHFELVD